MFLHQSVLEVVLELLNSVLLQRSAVSPTSCLGNKVERMKSVVESGMALGLTTAGS